MPSDRMDITKMCGFLKNSSRLILSTAHGGTSVGGAVFADVPPNVVIIEVGLATHSTWQSMSPKIITYFQNICNIGHHASPAGRAAAFHSHGLVLSEGDIKIIESSIRIYQGGDTMQVYNMTFSHEGDAAAFIREYPRGGARCSLHCSHSAFFVSDAAMRACLKSQVLRRKSHHLGRRSSPTPSAADAAPH